MGKQIREKEKKKKGEFFLSFPLDLTFFNLDLLILNLSKNRKEKNEKKRNAPC